jgi:hypothetical protein
VLRRSGRWKNEAVVAYEEQGEVMAVTTACPSSRMPITALQLQSLCFCTAVGCLFSHDKYHYRLGFKVKVISRSGIEPQRGHLEENGHKNCLAPMNTIQL